MAELTQFLVHHMGQICFYIIKKKKSKQQQQKENCDNETRFQDK